MGFIEAWGAFESQNPDLRIKELVKNKDLQAPIDFGIGKLQDTSNVSEVGVSNLKSLFAKNDPKFQQYTDEAVANIDKIMNGQLGSQLTGLRTAQYDARMDATNRMLDLIQARDSSSRARMGITGGNSYADLNRARVMREAAIPAELERVAMERGDLGYERDMQLSNAGSRQALIASLEGRAAVPTQMISALRGIPLQNIAGYQQLDDANKIRALWREKSMVERAGDWDAKNVEAIGQLIGMISGIGGMGGGPKNSAPNPRNAPAQVTPSSGMQYNTSAPGYQNYGGYGMDSSPTSGYGGGYGGYGYAPAAAPEGGFGAGMGVGY